MHFNADVRSLKMMMDLISSANDFCIVFGICDFLGKINEIDFDESRRNTASVLLSPGVSENVTQPRPRPCEAEHVSSCAPIAEGNLSARASPLENTWHAYSARSTAEGNFLQLPNQQTTKIVVDKANETTDKELVRQCKICRFSRHLVDRGNSFKHGLHETALDCSAHLAEKMTGQPVLKVDEYFEEQIPEAELGRSKKYRCSTKQEVEALM